MVPRTFISLAMLRAADDAGVDDADACTTVSTPGGLDHPGHQRVPDVHPGEVGAAHPGPGGRFGQRRVDPDDPIDIRDARRADRRGTNR